MLASRRAMLRKAGSGFDLALACAVLAADGVLPQPAWTGAVLLGELALDGRLRPVRGVLPLCSPPRAAGRRAGRRARGAPAEASLVDGLEVHGAATLARGAALARRGALLGGRARGRCRRRRRAA